LDKMEKPDLAAILTHQDVGSRLKETDKRPLSNYIYQLKLKRKKQEENEKKRSELGAQMSEKGMNILGQKTYEL
jgi:hypothetical protein